MGQRLNLEIKKKGQVICNAYYHWSAYTSSAFYLLDVVYDYLKNNKNEHELLRCIHAFEKTDAGLTEFERDYIFSSNDFRNIDFQSAIDRTKGLIAVSPQGIKENADCSECTVCVDITDQDNIMFNFNVVINCDKDEYLEYYSSINDNIIKYTFDPMNMLTYDQLYNYVNDLCNGNVVCYQDKFYIEI